MYWKVTEKEGSFVSVHRERIIYVSCSAHKLLFLFGETLHKAADVPSGVYPSADYV